MDIICEIGNPGQEESAMFSPLDRCDLIDVGEIIREELEGIEDDTLYVVFNGIQVVFNGTPVSFERMNNG